MFIFAHNSARSQMVERPVNGLYSRALDAKSAGTRPGRVHPLAVRETAELGIDISNQGFKSLDVFEGRLFDHVVMVCSNAAEACPFFLGG